MIDLTYFSPWPGHFDKTGVVNPTSFNFVDTQGDNLVVTIGCSWTWGANMTEDDNEAYRLKHNFGRVLADNLNADWLSLGQVATGNFWLYKKVQEFVKLVPTLKYKKIYIICTFTEVGRQCCTELDSHINYKEYFKTNKFGDNLLAFLNNHAVQQIISAIEPYDNIVLRIGTNFVDPIGLEAAKDYLIPGPWLSLICKQAGTEYTGTCYTVSNLAADRLRMLLKYISDGFGYVLWLTKLLDEGGARIQLCQRCNLLMPGTGHPGNIGHSIWAKEILKTL